ncbi:MAG: SRPBCC family protein [Rhizomicrobium sp.]|jgi:uncharacterized protein YndB with AHSA1/START domain
MTSKFMYVTYIRTTPEKLWHALTTPDFTRKFWFGMHQECDWKQGSSWMLIFADGKMADAGEVLEVDPPRRLVLRWHNEFRPELKDEGDTRCTFSIEPDGDVVKLTISHEAERAPRTIDAVSGGWPKVLSSLKSLLETGEGLPRSVSPPKG